MKTGIIVLNWNGLHDTIECVESLLPQLNDSAVLYVIDNGSTDESVLELRRRFGERIVLIANPRNLLYAGGNNVGIARALEDGCSHILLLNNDTTVAPDFVERMNQAAANLGDAIICPKIYLSRERDHFWYAGGELSLKRARIWHRGIREVDRGQYDRQEATSWATGCALMASRKVWETVGQLDTDFPLYMEDVDFSLRAKQQAFPIYYVPSAVMWHKVSAAVGGNLSRNKLSRKWKSLRMLMKKHVPNSFARMTALSLFVVSEAWRVGVGILTGRIK